MSNIVINAPGTTSSTVLNLVAGATPIEPRHGLTGTAPLHAVKELPEPVPERGLASPRGRGLLLWRRALHRSGVA